FAQLPVYMVPSVFVLIDSLPLNANGKIDRQALLALGTPLTQREKVFEPPQTPLEQVLAGIWAGVLDVKEVGATDSFFELGGHSLLATRAVTAIREVFPIDLPLRAIFESHTVRALAQYMSKSAANVGLDILTMARVLIDVSQLSDEEVESQLAE